MSQIWQKEKLARFFQDVELRVCPEVEPMHVVQIVGVAGPVPQAGKNALFHRQGKEEEERFRIQQQQQLQQQLKLQLQLQLQL